ncbi:MAG: hypothetical protein K1Y36_19750 [Blastocatellia bacterium]|nr:hypothetical protein [Blastocatellia bacterium]
MSHQKPQVLTGLAPFSTSGFAQPQAVSNRTGQFPFFIWMPLGLGALTLLLLLGGLVCSLWFDATKGNLCLKAGFAVTVILGLFSHLGTGSRLSARCPDPVFFCRLEQSLNRLLKVLVLGCGLALATLVYSGNGIPSSTDPQALLAQRSQYLLCQRGKETAVPRQQFVLNGICAQVVWNSALLLGTTAFLLRLLGHRNHLSQSSED